MKWFVLGLDETACFGSHSPSLVFPILPHLLLSSIKLLKTLFIMFEYFFILIYGHKLSKSIGKKYYTVEINRSTLHAWQKKIMTSTHFRCPMPPKWTRTTLTNPCKQATLPRKWQHWILNSTNSETKWRRRHTQSFYQFAPTFSTRRDLPSLVTDNTKDKDEF